MVSTRANAQSKLRDSRARVASQSNSFGRVKRNFNWAYFRPAGVIEVNSGVKNDGTVTAWEFHNYNSGGSGIQVKYDFPNQDIQFHNSKSPLRQGSYRGLAATANHFAREVHMDELAQLVGMDPVAFRLKNIKDARLKAVLEAAANDVWLGTKEERRTRLRDCVWV